MTTITQITLEFHKIQEEMITIGQDGIIIDLLL